MQEIVANGVARLLRKSRLRHLRRGVRLLPGAVPAGLHALKNRNHFTALLVGNAPDLVRVDQRNFLRCIQPEQTTPPLDDFAWELDPTDHDEFV